MEVTRDTAEFLLSLVNKVTLNVGAPDFEETAQSIVKAKAELQAILGPPKAE